MRYVLLRTLFILSVLAAGLVGMPDDVGAEESFLNSGSIDSSGARRIKLDPSKFATKPESENEGGALSWFAKRTVGKVTGLFGGGSDGGENMEPQTPPGDDVAMEQDTPDPTSEAENFDPEIFSPLIDVAALSEAGPLEAVSTIMGARDEAIERSLAIGKFMRDQDVREGAKARAEREAAMLAKSHRPPTKGEALFAEFGASKKERSPFEVVRATLSAAQN